MFGEKKNQLTATETLILEKCQEANAGFNKPCLAAHGNKLETNKIQKPPRLGRA